MYLLQPTKLFLKQYKELESQANSILEKRINLLKINPYRNKRINGFNQVLFRVRFKDHGKEKRLVYSVDRPFIKLICILDRKNDYKDLKKYLDKID
ncbi:MAG TPA: hypothetical protein VJB90_05380 [Candidatus Nanoarchaeia archaeon]|nr:hypothetical protein [Candidatus Nanoarchaeia archaeon]